MAVNDLSGTSQEDSEIREMKWHEYADTIVRTEGNMSIVSTFLAGLQAQLLSNFAGNDNEDRVGVVVATAAFYLAILADVCATLFLLLASAAYLLVDENSILCRTGASFKTISCFRLVGYLAHVIGTVFFFVGMISGVSISILFLETRNDPVPL